MSFTDQMASLRASLDDTKKRTGAAVRGVKRETKEILSDSRVLVAGYAQTQKANAEQLRESLRHSTQKLTRDVKEIRGDNIRSQRELKRDFASAHNVFLGKQRRQGKEGKPA